MFKNNLFFTLIRYDMLQTYRQAHAWMTPLLFFVIVVCLFPLAMGSNEKLLEEIAPAIIWVAMLLAILLSVGNIFKEDVDTGLIDNLLLSRTSLTLIVFSKIISHWLMNCLPLILISPLLGMLLHLSFAESLTLFITLLLGTPVFSLLGAIGSALTVGIKHNGLLLPILIMPFYIPVLIFGSSAVIAVNENLSLHGYYAILLAFVLLSASFAPFLSGLALRVGVNQ